jgi:nitronate monooxygenase
VLAAGGINDGKTIRAAFMLGAAGVQIGTAFIPGVESAASDGHKKAVLNGLETDLVLTRAITGRWARGFRNTLITAIENTGLDILPYPVQLGLTLPLRTIAQQQQNKEFISMWAGQALSQANSILPVATIFKQLVDGAEAAE